MASSFLGPVREVDVDVIANFYLMKEYHTESAPGCYERVSAEVREEVSHSRNLQPLVVTDSPLQIRYIAALAMRTASECIPVMVTGITMAEATDLFYGLYNVCPLIVLTSEQQSPRFDYAEPELYLPRRSWEHAVIPVREAS
jgi:hypothetical protein